MSDEIAWAVKVKSGGRWGWVGVDGFPIGWANRALHSKEGAVERLEAVMRQGATRARLVRVRRRTSVTYSTEQLAEQAHASFAVGRLSALEEAERVCREPINDMSCVRCADAIAALRGGK